MLHRRLESTTTLVKRFLPMPPEPSSAPGHILSLLARRNVTLELGTLDVCFIVALALRSERSALASFSEEELVDVFEQVCDAVEPSAEVRRVATHAIRTLA